MRTSDIGKKSLTKLTANIEPCKSGLIIDPLSDSTGLGIGCDMAVIRYMRGIAR